MPFMRQTKRDCQKRSALRIAKHSELAAFGPSVVTLEQFDQLRGPFRLRADRRFARAVCEAIAVEARVDPSGLSLDFLFVVCSIAVHRHRLKVRRPPPSYYAGSNVCFTQVQGTPHDL